MRKRGKIIVSLICSVTLLSCATLGVITFVSADNNDRSANSKPEKLITDDYTWTNPDITEAPPYLEEMSLAEKEWFEYVDYQYYKSDADSDYTYKIYTPVDYAKSSIMAIRDYDPDEGGINGSILQLGVTEDLKLIQEVLLKANLAVIGAGGVTTGLFGLTGQVVDFFDDTNIPTVTKLFRDMKDLLKNAPYYTSPDFMGIVGDGKWSGISNTGFYNCDSISISMSASETFSVQKTNTVSSSFSVEGGSKVGFDSGFIFAKVSGDINAKASSGLSNGINYQQSQSVNNSVTVSRTFSARKDKEVANVGWKLVEYVVRVPYKIDVTQTDEEGNESIVATSFVTQDLLRGVCRVFANGYIEHWNTGELVAYADFFEGFITATELISTAKAAMGANK